MRRTTALVTLATAGTMTLGLSAGSTWAAPGPLAAAGSAHHNPAPTAAGNLTAPADTQAQKIVAGLGGIDNIVEVEGGITRLYVEVIDPGLVDEAALKAAGVRSVVKTDTAVQLRIDGDTYPLAADIEDMM